MELLRPPGLRVHHGKVVQDGTLVLDSVIFINRHPGNDGAEYSFNLAFIIFISIECVETVVRKAAAHRPEEVVTLAKGLDQ